jgi:hypothetical protein
MGFTEAGAAGEERSGSGDVFYSQESRHRNADPAVPGSTQKTMAALERGKGVFSVFDGIINVFDGIIWD